MLSIRRRRPQTDNFQAPRREQAAGSRDGAVAGAGPHPIAARDGGGRPGAAGARALAAGAGDTGAARRRRGLRWHGRNAGAATVGAFGSGVMALASVVLLAAALIAVLIALAIVLVDVGANAGNTIVKGIHEGANFFASPFTGLIQFNGHPKRAITVDWGIALLVYLIAGLILSRWIARLGRGGVRFDRAHRPAV